MASGVQSVQDKISNKMDRCRRCMWQATIGMLAAWLLFAMAGAISPRPILLAFTLAMAVSFTVVLIIHMVALNMRRRAFSHGATPLPTPLRGGDVLPLSSDRAMRTVAPPPRGCGPCREREARNKLQKTYADSRSTVPVIRAKVVRIAVAALLRLN
jgi:hypothetical protein